MSFETEVIQFVVGETAVIAGVWALGTSKAILYAYIIFNIALFYLPAGTYWLISLHLTLSPSFPSSSPFSFYSWKCSDLWTSKFRKLLDSGFVNKYDHEANGTNRLIIAL